MTPTIRGTLTFGNLPPQARAYVALVDAVGAACLLIALTHVQFDHPVLFGALLALAIGASTARSPRRRARC
jgi:hypothetical protein